MMHSRGQGLAASARESRFGVRLLPTLFRFFAILLVIAAIGAAGMVYLATFVSPHTREMSTPIPAAKLQGLP